MNCLSIRVVAFAVPFAVSLLLVAPTHAETLKVPADYSSIADAVAAAEPFDVIVVAQGVYHENVDIKVADLTLQGKNTVIEGGYAGPCVSGLADGLTLTGFTLANGVSGVQVQGEDLSITGNTVLHCSEKGLDLTGNGSVEKNELFGCLGDGIVLTALASDGLFVVKKNTVQGCDRGIVGLGGFFEMEKNEIVDCEQTGIEVQVDAPSKKDGEVQTSRFIKNTCRGNGLSGLQIMLGANSAGAVIEKNVSQANQGSGLAVLGGDLLITGNTVEDNFQGGLITYCSGSEISKNKIRRNRFGGGALIPPEAAGGPVGGPNVFEKNTCEDNFGDGLILVSGGNDIRNNTFANNLGDGMSLLQAFDECVGNVIEDNTFKNNGHDGLDNSGTLTLVVDNKLTGNGGNDFAGIGSRIGTVDDASEGNVFDTGGADQPGLIELDVFGGGG